MNELYNINFLEKSIQDHVMNNYEVEANRAKIGYMAGECFWVRQALADIIMGGLPFASYFNPKLYEALYNLYLKLGVE